MKKALIALLAFILTASILLLVGCKGVVYDFSASNDFADVEQSATEQNVLATFVSTDGGTVVTEPGELHGYDHEAVLLGENDSVEYTVTLSQADKLAIYADWYILHNGLSDSEVEITVNGTVVSERSGLKALWHNKSEIFDKDSYGNEIVPTQEKLDNWQISTPLYEYDSLTAIAPVYSLTKGKTSFGSLLLRRVSCWWATFLFVRKNYPQAMRIMSSHTRKGQAAALALWKRNTFTVKTAHPLSQHMPRM